MKSQGPFNRDAVNLAGQTDAKISVVNQRVKTIDTTLLRELSQGGRNVLSYIIDILLKEGITEFVLDVHTKEGILKYWIEKGLSYSYIHQTNVKRGIDALVFLDALKFENDRYIINLDLISR